MEFGRGNADFPRDLEDDELTPLRSSDHDGFVVFLGMLPTIDVNPTSGLATSETGTSDTFTVSLSAAPSADVTIPVSSSDTTEGTVAPASLVFTPANWMTPQTVTVTGVDDDLVDGDVAYSIILGTVVTTDPCYEGQDPADVSATNSSKDAADIVVDAMTPLSTSENGSTDTFTVVLTSEPSADVTIGVSSDAPDEAVADVTQLVFTSANWDTPQTVTVTGQADGTIDGDEPFTILLAAAVSTDGDYDGIDPMDVNGVNTNVDGSGNFDIFVDVGGDILISGTPNALVGLYILLDDGTWQFVENVQLDDNGQGIATAQGQPDTGYGVVGTDNSFPPAGVAFFTVPVLGPYGMFILVALLLGAAMVINRRRRTA